MFGSKSQASDYAVGDIVEYLIKGKWHIGEVTESDYDGKIYLQELKGMYWGHFPIKTRQNDATFNRAIKIFEEDIKWLEDKMNHTYEKNRVKELRDKIGKLPIVEKEGYVDA